MFLGLVASQGRVCKGKLAAAVAAGPQPRNRSYVHHSELVFIAKVIEP